MHSSRPLLLGLTLLAVSSASGQARSTRDSAGVRIITTPLFATAPANLVLGKPLSEVGGLNEDPAKEFDHKQGYLRAALLSTGGMAVIDVVRVHYFDKAGKLIKIVGRSGAGPEEFRYLTSVCATRGDTVVAYDSHNARIAILDATGKVVRTIPKERNGSLPFDACFADGTFTLTATAFGGQGKPSSSKLTRLNTDGTVLNLLGEWAGPPFSFVTQTELTSIATGSRLVVGNPSTAQISTIDVNGKPLQSIRFSDARTPITDDEAETAMKNTIPRNTPSAEVTQRMERMRAMESPTQWPLFGRMHVDPLGRLWIMHHQRDYKAASVWTALDGAGKVVARLVLPPRGKYSMEVIAFGSNSIIMRRFDDDMATYLTTYPLVSAGAKP
ncbi:MAG: hypothetical protein IPG05_01510 [Gemmatimonadetes bacterium]|nr:hypothetical protein [Gemmatimonadota bacterium]